MSDPGDSSLSVLVVGSRLDPAEFRERLAAVTGRPVAVLSAASVEEAATAVDGVVFDCVVVPERECVTDGGDVLERLRGRDRSLPVVVHRAGGRDRPSADRRGTGPVTDVDGGDDPASEIAEAVASLATPSAGGSAADGPSGDGPVAGRFEALVRNGPDAVAVLNRDGTVDYASPAVESVLGYSPGALVGKQALEYVHPDDRDAVAADFFGDPAEWDGQRHDHVFRVEDPAGGWRTVEATARSELSDPRIEGVVVDARDVTGRERRTAELERFETIAETIPLGLLVLDERGRVVWANERFLELVGRSETSVIDAPFLEFVREGLFEEQLVEAYGQSVRRLLSEDVDGGAVMEQVHYYPPPRADVAREAYVFDVHLGLLPLEDGAYRGTVCAFRDVTDRERYQRELEEKNERLQQFASFVSHDLRNPLNVAQGYVDLAKDGDAGAVEEIEISLNRMERLIAELLTMAREGRATEELSPTDPGDVARASWRAVETGVAELVVETERPILAEESTLGQVFENLFRNAVEHGGAGVTVTVGDLEDDAGFYVADDGQGIPEADRDAVLDVGFTTDEGGTGFGLGIVSQIAENHGWTVSVGEGVDGGARFEFRGVESPVE